MLVIAGNVETACGAGLAAIYEPTKINELLKTIDNNNQEKDPIVVVIVCGGNSISLEALQKTKQ